MKANEAPEKIYLTPLECMAASCQPKKDNTIEYTQTDTFIEKAKTFICNHIDGSGLHLNYILKEFENYMKGEEV